MGQSRQVRRDLLVFGSTVWHVAVDQGIPEGSMVALTHDQIAGVIQGLAGAEDAALRPPVDYPRTFALIPEQETLRRQVIEPGRLYWSGNFDPARFGELLHTEESRLCQTTLTDDHEAVPDDTQLDWDTWNAKVEAVLQEWESQRNA